jgi:hypothetical protein
MKLVFSICALVAALAMIGGCSSPPPEVHAPPPVVRTPVQIDTLLDLSAALPGQPANEDLPDQALLEGASGWTPRFVATGLASGVMLEFTGMKKGKTLNAKTANIELRRYLHDTLSAGAGPLTAQLSGPMKAQAAVNNLHQAFFKVQPGTYFLRVTNPWADRRVTRDVVVHDGEYSVLSNDVYAAWLKRTKQLSDSTGAKVQE